MSPTTNLPAGTFSLGDVDHLLGGIQAADIGTVLGGNHRRLPAAATAGIEKANTTLHPCCVQHRLPERLQAFGDE